MTTAHDPNVSLSRPSLTCCYVATATQYLFQSILDLQATNLFLDIGHGIGNTCLQAAYTIGCDARGIERKE